MENPVAKQFLKDRKALAEDEYKHLRIKRDLLRQVAASKATIWATLTGLIQK